VRILTDSMTLPRLSTEHDRWARRSWQLLRWFGPLLIVAGALGFLVPAHLSLTSGAAPYNIFHIVAGVVAVAVILTGNRWGAAVFNLTFGLIDLWQAAAGMLSIFPADLFALRPADHVVHVVAGAVLVVVGGCALRTSPGQSAATIRPGARA
jgi:hypothetical protein